MMSNLPLTNNNLSASNSKSILSKFLPSKQLALKTMPLLQNCSITLPDKCQWVTSQSNIQSRSIQLMSHLLKPSTRSLIISTFNKWRWKTRISMIQCIPYLLISPPMLMSEVPKPYNQKMLTTLQSSKFGSCALGSSIYVLILSGHCCMFIVVQFLSLVASHTGLSFWTKLNWAVLILITTHCLWLSCRFWMVSYWMPGEWNADICHLLHFWSQTPPLNNYLI